MGYGQMARQSKEDRIFRLPEGDYKVRLLEHKFGKTAKKGTTQFKLVFKVLEAPSQEVMDKIVAKDRKIEFKAYPHSPKSNSFNQLLEFMLDAGCDLDSCDDTDQVKFTDLRRELSALEEKNLVCKAVVKPQEDNDQYYNCYLNDVPNVYQNVATQVMAQTGPSLADMLAVGWTVEMLQANPQYAHLVPAIPAAPVEAPVPTPTPEPVAEPVATPAPVVAEPVTPTPVAQPVATAPQAPAPVASAPVAPAPVATAPTAPAPVPVTTAPQPVDAPAPAPTPVAQPTPVAPA